MREQSLLTDCQFLGKRFAMNSETREAAGGSRFDNTAMT